MQRIILLILLLSVSLITSAQFLSDTIPHYDPSPPEGKFNISFTWFELGRTIPMNENLAQNLPSGLAPYFSPLKGSQFYGFFGLGLYYKNRWGVSVMYNSVNFTSSGDNFTNYLVSQYPNYYIQNDLSTFNYSLDHFVYRIGYRFRSGPMRIEPQFQFGVNDYSSHGRTYILKEKGSNHFISYSIQSENMKKTQISYRFGTVFRWSHSKPWWKWDLEPGIRIDFMLVPVEYRYTLKISPYDMQTITQSTQFKQWNPAFMISFVAGVMRK